MNLGYFYPSIYWKTACLSVDAGALNEEDFYNLVDTGILELTDEEDKRDQNKVKYGQIAMAIIKFKQYGQVAMPDINTSRFGFTPDAANNTIRFGLRGIARIGEQIIRDIILNRPYTSLQNFIDKMVSSDGKKLISKDKIVNLIKAGAFDNVENKSREEILAEFVNDTSDQKKRLTLQNFQMLINQGLIPEELAFSVKVFNFTKYIRKQRFMGNYILDEQNGMRFYSQHYDMTKVKQLEKDGQIVNVISDTYWDAIYTREMDKPRRYIKDNHDELLRKMNNNLFHNEFNKYGEGDVLQWELDSLSFYYSGHPLANVVLPVETTALSDLKENDFDGFWMIKGKRVPKYRLSTIVGTVIDKDKQKGFFTLQTADGGAIEVKVFKQQFAHYTHVISEVNEEGEKDILEDSFFEKGTHLVVTGIKRGEIFIPKVYKNTGFDAILKAVLDKNGQIDYLLRKSGGSDAN